jgi:hypothetical protein
MNCHPLSNNNRQQMMHSQIMKPLVTLGLGLALACAVRAADPAPPPAKLSLLILSGANNHDWKTTTPIAVT